LTRLSSIKADLILIRRWRALKAVDTAGEWRITVILSSAAADKRQTLRWLPDYNSGIRQSAATISLPD
jgi:hypothetical protein